MITNKTQRRPEYSLRCRSEDDRRPRCKNHTHAHKKSIRNVRKRRTRRTRAPNNVWRVPDDWRASTGGRASRAARRSRHCGDLWKPAKFWTPCTRPRPPIRRHDSPDERGAASRRRGDRNRWTRAIARPRSIRPRFLRSSVPGRTRDRGDGGAPREDANVVVQDRLARRPPVRDRCRRDVRRRRSLRTRAGTAISRGGQRPSGVRGKKNTPPRYRVGDYSSVRHRCKRRYRGPDHRTRGGTIRHVSTGPFRATVRLPGVTSTPPVGTRAPTVPRGWRRNGSRPVRLQTSSGLPRQRRRTKSASHRRK